MPAGNTGHTANGVYHKGVPDELQGVKVAGTIAIGITSAQVQIKTPGQPFHITTFPFAIG